MPCSMQASTRIHQHVLTNTHSRIHTHAFALMTLPARLTLDPRDSAHALSALTDPRIAERHPDSAPLPVLMYHAIGEPSCAHEASYTVPPALFRRHLAVLAQEGWTTMGLDALVDAMRKGVRLPRRTVALTFDDGFSCLHEQLGESFARGLKATAYIVTGSLDRMARFDRDLGIRARPMLSIAQLRELSDAGLEIGSHTVNHPYLRSLTDSALDNELHRSKQDLEQILGRRVSSFAYPRGRFDRRVRQAVMDAGYLTACCTMGGLNHARTDAFLIRRIQAGMHLDERALRQALRHGSSGMTRLKRAMRDCAVPVIAALQGRDPLDIMLHPLGLRGRFRSPAVAPSPRPASGQG